MLQWKREEPLECDAVKVERHNAVYPARAKQVSDQACADRVTTICSSVLARVTKVRNYRGQTGGAGAATRVDKHQQIEEMSMHRRARRLNQVHVAAAHTLLHFNVKFAVGKASERPAAERQSDTLGNRRGQRQVRGANENDRIHCRLRRYLRKAVARSADRSHDARDFSIAYLARFFHFCLPLTLTRDIVQRNDSRQKSLRVDYR